MHSSQQGVKLSKATTNMCGKLWHCKAGFVYLSVIISPAHFFSLILRVSSQWLTKIHLLHSTKEKWTNHWSVNSYCKTL